MNAAELAQISGSKPEPLGVPTGDTGGRYAPTYPPYQALPHEIRLPSAVRRAVKARSVAQITGSYPEPLGVPEPPYPRLPHETRLPSAVRRAVKAVAVDQTTGSYPEPLGVPEPPCEAMPHDAKLPSAVRRATKAPSLAC